MIKLLFGDSKKKLKKEKSSKRAQSTRSSYWFYFFVFIYHQASPRSGTLYLELEDVARRVRIQGEAVTVMTGTLLA